MILYTRKLQMRPALVRLIFAVCVMTCLFLLKGGFVDYACVLIALVAFGSIFPITDLAIDDNTIVVQQYFIYGFIHSKTVFTKDDFITMDAFEIEMANPGTWADEEKDYLTDPLIEKKYELKAQDIPGNSKLVKLTFSAEEYSLIKKNFLNNMDDAT